VGKGLGEGGGGKECESRETGLERVVKLRKREIDPTHSFNFLYPVTAPPCGLILIKP